MRGGEMPARQRIFLLAVIVVSTGLSLLMLGLAVCAPEPEPLDLGRQAPPPPSGVSAAAAIAAPEKTSVQLKSSINAARIIGRSLQIKGWVYVAGEETAGQKVYVQLVRHSGPVAHYAAQVEERPDVAAAFKNPLYGNAGFSALLPVGDTADIRACTVRLVVKPPAGFIPARLARLKGLQIRAARNCTDRRFRSCRLARLRECARTSSMTPIPTPSICLTSRTPDFIV